MQLGKVWNIFQDRFRAVMRVLPPGIFLRRLLISVAVVLFILLVWFFVALFKATAGEVAGALGSLIGGIIGAGAAVSAVFILIWQEKDEEKKKVGDAVKIEVTMLVKYVIGAISICQNIASGLKVPRQDAGYIVKNFAEDPVIYPAIADRVGLLPQPQATTEFYMRLAEAKVMVQALQNKTTPEGIMYTSAAPEYVTPDFAGSVADSLLTALQLARPIVANENEAENLRAWVEKVVVGHIDACLASAKLSFPNAETFVNRPPEA